VPAAPEIRRRIVVLALLVAAVVALAASDTVHGWIEQLSTLAAEMIAAYPRLGIAVFVVASILSAMLAFFSTALVVPVAIYAWGEGTTLALLWLSWFIGGCFSYAIGRTLGRRIAGWLIGAKTIEYYGSRLSAHAGFLTILLAQLALPSEVPGYVLGTLRYRFVVYLAALAIGELPYALGTVYLGESFLQREYGLLIAIGLTGIALSVLAFVHLHRRIERPAPDPAAHEGRVRFGQSSCASNGIRQRPRSGPALMP
jgi:uncharacterized membrane protein YdjX (TVP38/TMEM64 family)